MRMRTATAPPFVIGSWSVVRCSWPGVSGLYWCVVLLSRRPTTDEQRTTDNEPRMTIVSSSASCFAPRRAGSRAPTRTRWFLLRPRWFLLPLLLALLGAFLGALTVAGADLGLHHLGARL